MLLKRYIIYLKLEVDIMFKICVIGCGNMSKGGHGPSFKKYYEAVYICYIPNNKINGISIIIYSLQSRRLYPGIFA